MKNFEVKRSFNLKDYNTFGIASEAQEFIEITNIDELKLGLETTEEVFLLGGGSNLLLPDRLNKRVLAIRFDGIEILEPNTEYQVIRVGSGVNWHNLVLWTLNQQLGGLENLSLIPGTVGAGPIQNIGAYGVELKDSFFGLEFFDFDKNESTYFTRDECCFGYRDSIFKNELKGKGCITSVDLKLPKWEFHNINISYGAIEQKMEELSIKNPTPKDISEVVMAIRMEKLPDPATLGNSGSFFKNAIVDQSKLNELQARYPDIVHYPISDSSVKIPTGWLIEKAGWKGKKVGRVGCYSKQALVVVNYGGATASEVKAFIAEVQKSVDELFGIQIFPEVNIIEE